MKFICEASWNYSGKKKYSSGHVYDLTEEQIKEYTGIKRANSTDKEGAMKRFTPLYPNGEPKSEDEEPKRPELLKEASALGIKDANKMKVPELIEAIAKKKAEA
jgi:hypothetical protein